MRSMSTVATGVRSDEPDTGFNERPASGATLTTRPELSVPPLRAAGRLTLCEPPVRAEGTLTTRPSRAGRLSTLRPRTVLMGDASLLSSRTLRIRGEAWAGATSVRILRTERVPGALKSTRWSEDSSVDTRFRAMTTLSPVAKGPRMLRRGL